jgi:hypothetical protein
MMSFLKRLFSNKSEQQRMHDYLSQATDTAHLEVLQREWDRMSYADRKQW